MVCLVYCRLYVSGATYFVPATCDESFCATSVVKSIHYIPTMETDSESWSCGSEAEDSKIFSSDRNTSVSDCGNSCSDSSGLVHILQAQQWVKVDMCRAHPAPPCFLFTTTLGIHFRV
jgi:hypothetical protein